MVFAPIISGIFPVFQFARTAALPEPKELVHVMRASPTLLAATPNTVMVGADVPTFVDGGDVMVSEGGGEAPEMRVTTNDWLARFPPPSLAITVMVFAPTASGTAGATQAGEPLAIPDAPELAAHCTTTTPVPPDTLPLRPILAAVVDAGGGVTLSSSAAGPLRVAYSVRIAPMSPGANPVTRR